MAKKTNVRQDNCVKLIFRKYYLYIKTENQKYYLSTSVMLNFSIRQPNLTRTHFVLSTNFTRIATINIYLLILIGF